MDKTYIVIMKDKKFFAENYPNGGYPFWSDYFESAKKYKNKEELLKDKTYFKMFEDFFKGSKIYEVRVVTEMVLKENEDEFNSIFKTEGEN